MRIISKILVTLFFLFWGSQGLAFASEEFETRYEVHYEIGTSGRTKVSQQITLTNKLSRVHATQYSLTIEGTQIENISARDEEGLLKTAVRRQGEQTAISLVFNQKVVGTGKTLKFQVDYEVLGLAKRQGQTWEVNIPRLAQADEIDDYRLSLATPKKFGQPTYITPQPLDQKTEDNSYLFSFTKEQLASSGVRVTFGQMQIFDFVLNYHLQNPHLSLGETEIALPPDTAFQQMIYQKIDPSPTQVRIDSDGNWLALYRLGPKEKLNIVASGKVKILSQPRNNLPKPDEANLKKNLLLQKYWPVDNPLIRAEAGRLKSVQSIYNFVVQTLNYDSSRAEEEPERLGALEALHRPNQVLCTEFSDLFVTLTRAAGIPARGVSGYAYTENTKLRPISSTTDILHSWAEYWDKDRKIWVPVDPTWEKTTQGFDYFSKTDLHHFVFAVHGESSEQPYPAGSYKTENNFSKDIQVVFGQYPEEIQPILSVEFKLPQEIYSRQQNQGKVIFRNQGPTAFYFLEPQFSFENIEVLSAQEAYSNLAALPPFGKKEINLILKPNSLISSKEGNIKISFNNQSFEKKFKIRPFFYQLIAPLSGLLTCTLGLIYVKRKSR